MSISPIFLKEPLNALLGWTSILFYLLLILSLSKPMVLYLGTFYMLLFIYDLFAFLLELSS